MNLSNSSGAGNIGQFGSTTQQGFGSVSDQTGMAQMMGISFGQTGFGTPNSLSSPLNNNRPLSAFSNQVGTGANVSNLSNGFIFGSSQMDKTVKSPFEIATKLNSQPSSAFSNVQNNSQHPKSSPFQNQNVSFQELQNNSKFGDWLSNTNSGSNDALPTFKPVFGESGSTPSSIFNTANNIQNPFTNSNTNSISSFINPNVPKPGLFSPSNTTQKSIFSSQNSKAPLLSGKNYSTNSVFGSQQQTNVNNSVVNPIATSVFSNQTPNTNIINQNSVFGKQPSNVLSFTQNTIFGNQQPIVATANQNSIFGNQMINAPTTTNTSVFGNQSQLAPTNTHTFVFGNPPPKTHVSTQNSVFTPQKPNYSVSFLPQETNKSTSHISNNLSEQEINLTTAQLSTSTITTLQPQKTTNAPLNVPSTPDYDMPAIFLEAFSAQNFTFQKIPYIPPPPYLI